MNCATYFREGSYNFFLSQQRGVGGRPVIRASLVLTGWLRQVEADRNGQVNAILGRHLEWRWGNGAARCSSASAHLLPRGG